MKNSPTTGSSTISQAQLGKKRFYSVASGGNALKWRHVYWINNRGWGAQKNVIEHASLSEIFEGFALCAGFGPEHNHLGRPTRPESATGKPVVPIVRMRVLANKSGSGSMAE